LDSDQQLIDPTPRPYVTKGGMKWLKLIEWVLVVVGSVAILIGLVWYFGAA
jgi:hypothetical protein